MDDAPERIKSRTARHARGALPRRLAAAVTLAGLLQCLGCAAFHPLRGVPASYLADEYQGPSRSNKQTINLNLLVRRPPDQFRIDAGDVLAVFIPGVLGRMSTNLEEAGEEPPINTPHTEGDPPTIGYPVTVRDDGTVPLPYVNPVHVAGLTLAEVEAAIRRAYSVETTVLADRPDVAKRVVVSLQRPREHRILVVRQETSDNAASGNQVENINIGMSKRGTATIVRLRAYENDVLHALARAETANGLPGLDAENAIYIIRRRAAAAPSAPTPVQQVPGALPVPAPVAPMGGHSLTSAGVQQTAGYAYGSGSYPGTVRGPSYPQAQMYGSPSVSTYPAFQNGQWLSNAQQIPWTDAWSMMPHTMDDPGIIRIPVRLGPGEYPQISEDDITLYDGDIVFIESRETEVFYTGGLLGGGQYTLPRDYDLRLTQALSIAQARSTGGGSSRAIGGVSALNSDVTISPSHVVILRTLPDGRRFPVEVDLYRALRRREEDILIQPGDMIMLQYTHLEAVAAFIERHLLEGALFGVAAASLQTNGN